MIYLGRSHFRNSRANLIQTLRMVEAFETIGHRTRLYLPARRGLPSVAQRLEEFGIQRRLDIRFSPLLKSRWQFGAFIWLHRRELSNAQMVYTRVPEISLRLSRAGVRHHLEVHDIAELRKKRLLDRVVGAHRKGTLEWMIPISRTLMEALAQHGAVVERMHVAPSGVDVDAYSGVVPFDPRRLDRPRLVYVGRVTRDRGLDIFRAVAKSIDCEVTLVGDCDEEVDCDRIRIVPFVPPRDVPKWYAQCDIALLPYQPDLPHAASISPIKLFEAMAAGRPVIASNLPTIHEVLRHEHNSLLVDPTSTGAWIAAVERLRQDRALAARLAAQAMHDAQQYDWRSRAAAVIKLVSDQNRQTHRPHTCDSVL